MSRAVSLLGWIAIAFGVLAAGVQISQLAMHGLGFVSTGQTVGAEPPVTADPVPADLLAPLIAAAPFGERTVFSDAGSPAGVSSSWTLSAVRLANPPSRSTATISVSDGPPKIYRVGDTIDGGAEVTHIDARSVRLSTGLADETLSFPVRTSRARLSGIYADKAAQYAAVPGAPRASGLSQSIATTDTIRNQIQANPKVLLDSFGLSPSADGYTVGTDADAALFLAGLKPGDRVVKVNGSSVGNIEHDRQLFEQAVLTGHARVEIIRDGRVLVLSFPLR